MAQAIDHSETSSVSTVAASAAKWSLVGAVAGGLVTFGVIVGTAGIAGSIVGSLGVSSAGFGSWAGAFLGGNSALTWLAAIGSVVGGGANIGLGALVGGVLGMAKGSDQVSAEKAAHRALVSGLTNNRTRDKIKAKTDAEINTYMQAMNDMKPQMDAMYRKGQEDLAGQIQQHMMQEAQMAQAADPAHTAGVSATAIAKAECACVGPETEKLAKQRKHSAETAVSGVMAV